MLKKTIASFFVSAFFTSTLFAAVVCPSENSIKNAIYKTAYAPNFFMYALNNSLVIVSIPPTDKNPHPSKTDADALLQKITHPYTPDLSGPCFYAPFEKFTTTEQPFVMWTDQLPPA